MRTTSGYYKRKRINSGLSKIDMANELGLTFNYYSAIERGDVKMPSNLIDKFNEIINRGEINKITKNKNTLDADAFWEEMRKQDKDGRYALYNKMEEFNIPSMKELARLLGYKSPGSLYAYLKGERVTNVDFKKRVFMFFSDELNVQIPKTNEKTYVKTKNTNDDPEMDAYYRNTDFVKLLRNANKTQKELAEIVGVTSGVISRMVNRKNKPGDRTLRKIKEYFENTGVNRKVVEEVEPVSKKILEEISSSFPEIPTSTKAENSNTIATRYRNELTSIDEEINKLNIRKSVCLEVLKVIEELEQGK